MKKLTTLVLVAGLVVSSFAGAASAAEFKPFAQFAEEFSYGDAGTNDNAENFNAATRVRLGFDYVASEDLSATILFQYNHKNWGANNNGFATDPTVIADRDDFRMRLAYIDWTIPATEVKVRMGRQALVAPSYAFGSAILDGRGDAVSFNGAINDNISLGFAWMRVDNDTNRVNGTRDAADAVMLNAEFAYDGFKVAPWVMYAHKDDNAVLGTFVDAGNNADAYVIGVSAELNMFDPFVFAVDALYNNVTRADVAQTAEDLDGWYVAAKASYKFSNGTANLGAWYASGDDLDNNDNGFIVLDGGFSATHILFDGDIIGNDAYCNAIGNDSPFGTWGIIAEYAGFSFLQDLSHTIRVAYVQGTNETVDNRPANASDIFGGTGMSEDDSVVEIDFDSTYQIYKNLSATLQLGYAIIDQDNLAPGVEEQDDIFRSALTFVYNF